MIMTHKQKIKVARRLLSKVEIKKHTPIFQSKSWNLSKIAIMNKKNNG